MKKLFIITSVLIFAYLMACTPQGGSNDGTPLNVPSGEVYENKTTGIGIVLPSEYIDKYRIIQFDVDSFSVYHNASYELYLDNEKNDETSKMLGFLFGMERLPLTSEDDIHNMNNLNDATHLFQTSEYAYYLRRPSRVEYDESTPEPWQTTEYKDLYTNEMMDKIIASAYPLE